MRGRFLNTEGIPQASNVGANTLIRGLKIEFLKFFNFSTRVPYPGGEEVPADPLVEELRDLRNLIFIIDYQTIERFPPSLRFLEGFEESRLKSIAPTPSHRTPWVRADAASRPDAASAPPARTSRR